MPSSLPPLFSAFIDKPLVSCFPFSLVLCGVGSSRPYPPPPPSPPSFYTSPVRHQSFMSPVFVCALIIAHRSSLVFFYFMVTRFLPFTLFRPALYITFYEIKQMIDLYFLVDLINYYYRIMHSMIVKVFYRHL